MNSLPKEITFFEVKPWEKELITQRLGADKLKLCEDTLTLENVSEYQQAEVISVFITSQLNAELLSKLPELKLIATRSTGFDHIDVEYCKQHNIFVANVPSYGENTVAEHAMALILSIAKRIPESMERVQRGVFSPDGLTGFDLKDKVIGIVGTGHIGQNMIQMANGFKMKVIAFDLFPKKELEQQLNFTYVDLDYLFSKADIISIHVPYTKETHHLINRDSLGKLKKGVVIVNTSRGGIIETDVLFDGLRSGVIGGAGLDVVEQEAFVKEEIELLHKDTYGEVDFKVALENHMMSYFPNVIITPHNAFNSHEALIRIIQTTLDNIECYKDGSCKNLVK